MVSALGSICGLTLVLCVLGLDTKYLSLPRCACVADVLRDVKLLDGPDKMLGHAWVLCNILAYHSRDTSICFPV